MIADATGISYEKCAALVNLKMGVECGGSKYFNYWYDSDGANASCACCQDSDDPTVEANLEDAEKHYLF